MAFDYSNYVPVEYIESTGTQFIKTDCPLYDGIAEMDVSFNAVNTAASYQSVIGGRSSSGIAVFLLSRSSALGYGYKGAWKTGLATYAANTRYTVRTSLLPQPASASMNINGTDYGVTGNFSPLPTPSAYYYDIFAYNSESNSQGHLYKCTSGVKLYSLSLYDTADNLIYEFIPCRTKDATPAGGLYETVHEKFFGNIGTGVFGYGADISTGSNVWIKDSGTWKQADAVYVKDGGTWKAATTVFIKDSGSWIS